MASYSLWNLGFIWKVCQRHPFIHGNYPADRKQRRQKYRLMNEWYHISHDSVVIVDSSSTALHWHHNGSDGISNHQPLIVNSNFHTGEGQRKHQSSTSLALVWGIDRWPVNSPHKWPVTQKMYPFDDAIMRWGHSCDNCIDLPEDSDLNLTCPQNYACLMFESCL